MTKAAIVDYLCSRTFTDGREGRRFTKEQSTRLLKFFLLELRLAQERNETVKLSGFGRYGLSEKSERPGSNPMTGQEVPVAARRVVNFKACSHLKGRARNYVPADASGEKNTGKTGRRTGKGG